MKQLIIEISDDTNQLKNNKELNITKDNKMIDKNIRL